MSLINLGASYGSRIPDLASQLIAHLDIVSNKPSTFSRTPFWGISAMFSWSNCHFQWASEHPSKLTQLLMISNHPTHLFAALLPSSNRLDCNQTWLENPPAILRRYLTSTISPPINTHVRTLTVFFLSHVWWHWRTVSTHLPWISH